MHTCHDDTQNLLKTFTKETTRKNNIKSIKGITEKDIYKLFDNEKKGTEKEYIGQETNRSDMNLSFEEEQKIPLDENSIVNVINQKINLSNINSDNQSLRKEEENKNEEVNININKKEQILITEKEINTINKKKKEKRKDNLRKEILKKPVLIVKNIIEKDGNKKLIVNLDEVIGTSYKQNRAILKLKIYEILCINHKNKNILEKIIPKPEEELKFYYLLTRTYEFIYENYLNNNRIFKIGEDDIRIEEFKVFEDIINEMKNETKIEIVKVIDEQGNINKIEKNIKKYNEKEMNKFINISKNYFKALKNGFFDERKPKSKKIFLVTKCIKKFEDFLKNEKSN